MSFNKINPYTTASMCEIEGILQTIYHDYYN